MCETCGCNITPGNVSLAQQPVSAGQTTVEVLENLLHANDHAAGHNREHFERHGVLAVNLMSSPGSGKTALLEATIEALGERLRVAVIEGDLETENDAQRIRAKGVPAIQITTGTACHLDAHLVHDALHHLPLADLDVVFIENVGNLVCPASFDLGHHLSVTLLSVTEGDDKPAKYPVMFRGSDVVVVTKTDVAPYFEDFDTARVEAHVRALACEAPVLEASVRSPGGIDAWLDWLQTMRSRFAVGERFSPAIERNPPAHTHPHGHHHHHGHEHESR